MEKRAKIGLNDLQAAIYLSSNIQITISSSSKIKYSQYKKLSKDRNKSYLYSKNLVHF